MPGDYNNCEFIPAASTNYRQGRLRAVDRVIIHVTQSSGDGHGDASWFAQARPQGPSSAHYIIGPSGNIIQSVREADTAYAAPNYNARGIHIEHVGWVGKTTFPRAQLEASAKLVAHLCAKYGISMDRIHILGHSELEGNDHTDPGDTWPWVMFMALVRGGTGTLTPPIWAHKDGIKVKGAVVYGLNWPKDTHHVTVLADGRWQVYAGDPEPKLKIQLHDGGKRKLLATAYDIKNKVIARDELEVVAEAA